MSSPKNGKSEDECESSAGSPTSTRTSTSSPETPTNNAVTNDSKKDALIPKRETSDSLSASTCTNSQDFPANVHTEEQHSRSGQSLPPPNPLPSMLLPPYVHDGFRAAQAATPETISLSNYVKLMTLQQGNSAGGPPIYPMPPGGFQPGIIPDTQNSEMATIVPPTSLAPPYPDVGYPQCLLGPFSTSFQHPMAKPSGQPSANMKAIDDKGIQFAYQQDVARIHGRSDFPHIRRQLKRAHDHSTMEPDEGRVAELGLELADRGSQFPPEGEGGVKERRSLTSDIGERLPHQLKWRAHMVDSWQGMCDAALIDIHSIGFQVETDKGFNFSIIDDSFVCQKKNHFQVTVTVLFNQAPKFVKMKNGSIQPIEKFTLNLHGVRFEQVNSNIQLEQSRSDRSKVKYTPDVIEIPDNPEKAVKRTVCRLHFSETTQNNMRKRGKPNPDQKYFSLVVALHAETSEESIPVVAHVSERIIVRASNPGNFDSDSDYLWYRCPNSEYIFHHGRVGINTDKPDEALTVHGNIQVTGQVLQISDSRVKRNIEPVEFKSHLDNISRLRLYHYQLATDSGNTKQSTNGASSRMQVGLLAQEVRKVIPDAVMETTAEAYLENGECVRDLLMVDKDQVLMETIGAVQELGALTRELSKKLNRLDKQQRLSRRELSLSCLLVLLIVLLLLICNLYYM